MRKLLIFSVLLAVIGLSGCQTTTNLDYQALEPMHSYRPASILVVPVKNNVLDVHAPTSLLATLPQVLGERGYYVFPVNTVKTILESEGYYEAAEVHQVPAATLTELFGADTVLYVTIHEWDAKYIVVATTTVVDFEYTLVSRQGDVLWHARKEVSYTPENDHNAGSPLANLFAAAIEAALERASPKYLQLTRQANQEAFLNPTQGLPPGPYSRNYSSYYETLEKIER